MTISFDWVGAYLEHKTAFDQMAISLQKDGHKVGIITGEREPKRTQIIQSLGFQPDFLHLWGEFESISNGDLWKCLKMDEEDVYMHFDDDARGMKKYTGRWVVKTLNSGDLAKF